MSHLRFDFPSKNHKLQSRSLGRALMGWHLIQLRLMPFTSSFYQADPRLPLCLAGLGAGFVAVCVGSPVDVVKSRVMGESPTATQRVHQPVVPGQGVSAGCPCILIKRDHRNYQGPKHERGFHCLQLHNSAKTQLVLRPSDTNHYDY